jgi:glycosyltransferase involved in cell wall biosynthesis
VSIGRLAEPKDFGTLISAVADLPLGTVRLVVVGDGPQRAVLEAQVKASRVADAIEFVGEVDDVRARLERADAFVLSSRSEGMPISVLEAMAAGLPVVATDVGGVHEVVLDGETGRLVPPGDVRALAAALSEMVDDAELRERWGRAGRRRIAERFELRAWRAAHLALYERLLSGSGRGQG